MKTYARSVSYVKLNKRRRYATISNRINDAFLVRLRRKLFPVEQSLLKSTVSHLRPFKRNYEQRNVTFCTGARPRRKVIRPVVGYVFSRSEYK